MSRMLRLLIPIAYAIVLIISVTSQFFFPTNPTFIYLLSFYSSWFISPDARPAVSVSLLPTLLDSLRRQPLHAPFGYMNLAGVLIQILFLCSLPWYEVIHGLTPANYGM
ncbi:hypothetical protein FA15DRAFT_674344, partial [Coprinopsis marcescibilis]